MFGLSTFQISDVHDVNGNVIEEGKEPVHPSKLTLTEALAIESGGMVTFVSDRSQDSSHPSLLMLLGQHQQVSL